MILVLGHTSCGAINGATQVPEKGCFLEVAFHRPAICIRQATQLRNMVSKNYFTPSTGTLKGPCSHGATARLQAYLSKKDGDTSVSSALEGLLRDLMEVAETWKETRETHRLTEPHSDIHGETIQDYDPSGD